MTQAICIFLVLYIFALPLSLGAMEILLPLLCLMTLVWGLRSQMSESPALKFKWSTPKGYLFLVSLLTVAFVSAIYNDLPTQRFIDSVGKLRWILLYYLLHNLFFNLNLQQSISKYLRFLYPLVGLIALFAFSQYWTGFDLLRGDDFKFPLAVDWDEKGYYRWRSIGFFNSPLTYGYVFAGFLCLFWGLGWQSFFAKDISRFRKIAFGTGLIVISLSLITCHSRGVWIALLVGLSATAYFINRRLLLYSLGSFGLLLLFYVLADVEFYERLTSIFDMNYASNLERLKLWKANWYIFMDSPWIGVGYEQNDFIVGDYFKKYNLENVPESHAHNTYLQFMAGTGIIGTLSFLGFIYHLLKQELQLVYQSRRKNLFAGIIGLHISILVGGLTECAFKDAEVNHLFVFFAALVSATWLKEKSLQAEGQEQFKN